MDNHHFFGGIFENKIEICKYKLPYDYHIVKEWVENAF